MEDAVYERQGEEEEEEIWSWGAGTEGQLGNGKLEDEHFPQLLDFPSLSSPISFISCGGAHAIALTSGRVLTWGRGSSGQLGHGELVRGLVPKTVTALETYFITHISAGWNHSAFVSDEGKMYTCGDGSFGQLGHGDYSSHCSPVEVSFFVDKHVDQVACGMRHSLALLKGCSAGQVYGFGAGKRGQLGISKGLKSTNLPLATCGLEDVEIVSITANGDHSVALSADGQLYSWGRGFGCNSDVHAAQSLSSSFTITKVALGWNHALVLTGDMDVYMLGGKNHGILGDSTDVAKYLSDDPKETLLERVPGVDTKVVDVAAGAEHSALVTEEGEVKTWGWGEHGQLGLGNTCDQTIPQTVGIPRNLHNEDGKFRVYCGSGFTVALKKARYAP